MTLSGESPPSGPTGVSAEPQSDLHQVRVRLIPEAIPERLREVVESAQMRATVGHRDHRLAAGLNFALHGGSGNAQSLKHLGEGAGEVAGEVLKIAAGHDDRKPRVLAHEKDVALVTDEDQLPEPVAKEGGGGCGHRGRRTHSIKELARQAKSDHEALPCLAAAGQMREKRLTLLMASATLPQPWSSCPSRRRR